MKKIIKIIKKDFRKYALLVLFFILVALFFYSSPQRKIYLYSWDNTEDFYFLEKEHKNITIVHYVGNVILNNNSILIMPRKNIIYAPEEIKHFPIIRIDNFSSPQNLTENIDKIVDFVYFQCKDYPDCQIDFDAKEGEREPYKTLLERIKTKLPNTRISITALVSWCGGSSWINDLPISFAAPMLYRLGQEDKVIKSGKIKNEILSNRLCKDFIVLSIDEMDFDFKKYIKNKDIYLFNPNSWIKKEFNEALKKI